MKKSRLLITSLLFLVFALITHEVRSHVNGAQAGLSGAPGENNCTQCHNGTVNSGTGTVLISSNAPADQYVPGTTYTITVSIEQSGITRFGFEVLSAYSSFQAKSMGTILITNTSETQQKALGNKRYVTHKLAGTTGSSTKTWTYDWTAPDPGVGQVIFYLAANAANNSGNTSGDKIYTRTLVLNEIPVSIFDKNESTTQSIVFPSITENLWNLKIENAGFDLIELNVFDVNGKVVFNEEITPIGSTMQRTYSSENWPAGIYFVKIVKDGETEVSRLIKI